jgi:hypothetical protein
MEMKVIQAGGLDGRNERIMVIVSAPSTASARARKDAVIVEMPDLAVLLQESQGLAADPRRPR